MSAVHVFAATSQPATRWVDPYAPEGYALHESSPRATVRCFKCRRLRWAAYAVVHVYYDEVYAFCAPGRGCKVPKKRRARKLRRDGRKDAVR